MLKKSLYQSKKFPEFLLRHYNFQFFSPEFSRFSLSFLKIGTFSRFSRETEPCTILHAPCFEEINIVYDSYLEDSIKECERIRRRSSLEPLEFVNLNTTTTIPVQMDRFWVCGK